MSHTLPAILVVGLIISPLLCEDRVHGGPGGAHNSPTVPTLLTKPPTILPNPNTRAPLVAIVEFQTSEESDAVLQISDGTRQWQQSIATIGTFHRAAIFGMYPNRSHSIEIIVRAISDSRTEASQPLTFTTPPLPESFPPVTTILANPSEMEPGITLFAVNNWTNNVSLMDYGYLVALDASGQVVWFCHTRDRTSDSRVLTNGHLLYQHGNYRCLYEVDLLGRDHRCWYAARTTQSPNELAIAVDVDTMHHEVLEMPNGNFLTLSTELRRFERYPTSEFDEGAAWGPAWVVCDEVVEFDPDTGQVVQRLPLTDLLDTSRFGYLSLGEFWRDKYDEFLDSPSRDWSHANAIQYNDDDGSILVSFRHLDCVVSIDWRTKELRWILGNPKGWSQPFLKYLLQPMGKLDWFYHQHAPHFADDGTLLMFDNGNYRALPYERPLAASENFSRIVAYQIDSAQMSVRQLFHYGAPQGDRFYTPFFGEAQYLPTSGNILVTDGGRIENEQGAPLDDVPGQRQWARIFELSSERFPAKVFEVKCASPLGSTIGWSIYRADRYPSLTNPFHLDLRQFENVPRVFPRGPVRKVNPLTRYEPIVVPGRMAVQDALTSEDETKCQNSFEADKSRSDDK